MQYLRRVLKGPKTGRTEGPEGQGARDENKEAWGQLGLGESGLGDARRILDAVFSILSSDDRDRIDQSRV